MPSWPHRSDRPWRPAEESTVHGLSRPHKRKQLFSEHYLAILFEEHRREWERQAGLNIGTGPSYRQLQRLFHRSRHAHAQLQQTAILPRAADKFQYVLLTALGLGYERHRTTQAVTLQDQTVAIPTLARVARAEATDALWILEAREAGGENGWGQDPLSLSYDPTLYSIDDLSLPRAQWTLHEAIETGIYGQR